MANQLKEFTYAEDSKLMQQDTEVDGTTNVEGLRQLG
jgi:hypothetical protein